MNGGEVVFNIKADSSDAKKEIQQTGEAVKDVGGGLEQAKTAAQSFSEAFRQAFKEAYDEAAEGAGEVQSATDAAGAGLDNYKKRLQERITDTIYDYVLQTIKEVTDATKALVTETAAVGDTIDKQSQRLGMSNEEFQEWSYILSQNGADISTLTMGMKTLTNQIDALGSGSKTATASFDALGLSYKDLQGLTGEQQLSVVIERLQGISDETERNAIANDVLGRSYMDLVPLLNQSSDSIEALRQRAHDTGQIMSDEAVSSAVNYTDAMDTLSRSFDGFKERIGAELLPGITEVAEGLTDLLTGGEDASEKIQQGIDDMMEGAKRALPAVEELVGDIASACGERAPEIIVSLLNGLIDAVPKLAGAATNIITGLVGFIRDELPQMGQPAGEAVTIIALEMLKMVADPQTWADLLTAFVQLGGNICEGIADGIVGFDWQSMTDKLTFGMADVLDTAQKNVQVFLDNTFSGGSLYGGDINNVESTPFIENMRAGAAELSEAVGDATETAREAYEQGKAELEKVFGTGSQTEGKDAVSEELETIAEDVSAGAGAVEDSAKGISTATNALTDELAALEQQYALHKLSEGQYWAQRRAILDKYRDEESTEWWKYYDDVEEYYTKLADTEAKAQADAAKAEEKAAADAEKQLKQEVSAKFRELETEALKNGYDDQWLIDQENAFIETLDHESDLYKEYHLKLLKEQESYNSKAEKAEKQAADNRQKELSKLYDSVVQAQEKLSDSLDVGVSDIFKSETETDKRTGETREKKSIGIEELEKQIEAKRQLPSKIADLLDSGAPDDLVRELLKLDPTDALEYAKKLLSSPNTLDRVTKVFDEDKTLSDRLAGMLTENTEDFDKLGRESGKIFGEGFFDSLGTEWKERFGEIVTDDALFSSLASAMPLLGSWGNFLSGAIGLSMKTADMQAAQQGITAVNGITGALGSDMKLTLVDANGSYVATLVNNENTGQQTRTGG